MFYASRPFAFLKSSTYWLQSIVKLLFQKPYLLSMATQKPTTMKNQNRILQLNRTNTELSIQNSTQRWSFSQGCWSVAGYAPEGLGVPLRAPSSKQKINEEPWNSSKARVNRWVCSTNECCIWRVSKLRTWCNFDVAQDISPVEWTQALSLLYLVTTIQNWTFLPKVANEPSSVILGSTRNSSYFMAIGF